MSRSAIWILFIHATLGRLLGPGTLRSVVPESILVKLQLLTLLGRLIYGPPIV